MLRPRDEEWLALEITNAETLMAAKLAVSVFLAGRAGMPLRPLENVPLSDQIGMVSSRFNYITNTDREVPNG